MKSTVFIYTFLLRSFCGAFVPGNKRQARSPNRLGGSQLSLVPIAHFKQELPFLSKPASYRCSLDDQGRLIGDEYDQSYTLCLVEEKDLPDVATFVLTAFGAEAITLSKDMNSLERALLSPPVGLINAYSGAVAYAEVLSGITSRSKAKVVNPNLSPPRLDAFATREEKLKEAERNSLILALARPTKGSDWRCDVIALIELRLQPCDAKIPFSLPWLDEAERRLAFFLRKQSPDNKEARRLQPYLSNLCVDESYRGKNIGKALVRVVEDIASSSWGYKRIYLHVDPDNEPALKLYQNEGYADVKKRWSPFWAGSAVNIGYFVKKL